MRIDRRSIPELSTGRESLVHLVSLSRIEHDFVGQDGLLLSGRRGGDFPDLLSVDIGVEHLTYLVNC